MKIISILAASLIFVGCAQTSMPSFPDIKKHYMLQIFNQKFDPTNLITREKMIFANMVVNPQDIHSTENGERAHCLEFDIISTRPYKIKFNKEVELEFCSGVGGYTPKDFVKLMNWISDVDHWAESRPKKCFK